ncbi:MAG: hypothetical protein ACUVTX_05535 [Bacteroidales bacterium]
MKRIRLTLALALLLPALSIFCQTGPKEKDLNNKIPVIAWIAAMHSDYHQPSDEVARVNWNKILDIIKLAFLQVWEAANGDIK